MYVDSSKTIGEMISYFTELRNNEIRSLERIKNDKSIASDAAYIRCSGKITAYGEIIYQLTFNLKEGE